MSKILIVSISVGNGHTRAAEALKKAVDLFYPQIQAKHIDFLNFVGLASKKIFFESYDLIIKKLPTLYRTLYDLSDNQVSAEILKKITALNRKLNTDKFQQYLNEFSPDAVIFTHFAPVEVFNSFNKNILSATIITDYENHQLWYTGNNQKYFVAQPAIKNQLIELGAQENNIIISGIPIDPDFYKIPTEAEILFRKQQLRIAKNKKIIAFMPCGQGEIDPIKLSKIILKEKDTVILALTGKNKPLAELYKEIGNDNIKIIGWTDKIYEYLNMSDCIITKPGGLAVSECLVLKKPMILINPIPGQEEKNIINMVGLGAGLVLKNEKDWPVIWNNLQKIILPDSQPKIPATKTIVDYILTQI